MKNRQAFLYVLRSHWLGAHLSIAVVFDRQTTDWSTSCICIAFSLLVLLISDFVSHGLDNIIASNRWSTMRKTHLSSRFCLSWLLRRQHHQHQRRTTRQIHLRVKQLFMITCDSLLTIKKTALISTNYRKFDNWIFTYRVSESPTLPSLWLTLFSLSNISLPNLL